MFPVSALPSKGLAARKEQALADKLAEYKASLSEEEQEQLITATAELKQYQSEPSPKEILETIPLLTIDDIRREAEPIYNKELSEHEIPILQHEIETNGIAYVDMLFDIHHIAAEDVPYLASDTVFKFMIPRETGVYILQIVPDAETARTDDKFLVSTRFKVLTLDLGDDRMEVVTLDARSGQPIADAKVSFYSSYDEKNRKVMAEVLTDAGGKAVLPWQSGIRSYVARKGRDTGMMPQNVYMNHSYYGIKDTDWRQMALLTDRSLYRPGQTVHVKGIAYKQNSDNAQVLQGVDYELVLLDANRKELATRKVQTNDFGSFATEFVLPAACLNGMFSIRTKEPQSTVTFRVEEYKRPTFEIAFTPVSEAYRLGGKVVLKGNVKAFNGMMVQDVPLAYTVTRRNPRPGYWSNADKPLLSDTIQLDANGDFSIPLTLEVPVVDTDGYGSVYTYHVEAVVTDEAGETQSASYNLLVGPKAYPLMSACLNMFVRKIACCSLLE